MTAELNMTQSRIFNAVVRYTFGYNKQEGWLSLDYLSQLTRCDKRQVRRELKRMIDRQIILERKEDKKRHLRINPKLKNQIEDSLDPYVEDSLDLYKEDSLDPYIKKDIKEIKDKEKYYIDLTIDDSDFINIYLNYFSEKMKKKHPRVSEDNYAFVINQIEHLKSFDVTEENWKEQVVDHFTVLPKSNNGSIVAFLHASHRYFEVHMYNQF